MQAEADWALVFSGDVGSVNSEAGRVWVDGVDVKRLVTGFMTDVEAAEGTQKVAAGAAVYRELSWVGNMAAVGHFSFFMYQSCPSSAPPSCLIHTGRQSLRGSGKPRQTWMCGKPTIQLK